MKELLDVKFDRFIEDFSLQNDLDSANWRRFINYHYFSQFQPGRLDTEFDDNVRDSQGYSTVNQEILSTLKEHPERFVLFNNGITIVCKKVELKNSEYELENPQIVNGCQTCNMI